MDTLDLEEIDFIEITDEETGDVYFCEYETEPLSFPAPKPLEIDWNSF